MSAERRLRRGATLAPGLSVVRHFARTRVYDVYDAWDDERGTRVIAKTLRPAAHEDASAARRLRREGRLLRQLAHPHLVRAYETHPGPPPVVVLETLTGETVAHLVDRRERRLSAVEIAVLGLQLASAVGYLHGRGWLHLDLKPSNLVAEAGRVKVLDLGLAQRPGKGKRGAGTWSYLAPEQARGDELGPPADVWGIGATLWEAATALQAFGEDDEEAQAFEFPQLERRAEPVLRHRRLPAELARAIDACLEPDAAARPSLAQLVAMLRRAPGTPDLRRTRA